MAVSVIIETTTPLTRAWAVCRLLASSLRLVVGLIQALTCPGSDLLRYDLSSLANRDLGWVQMTNLMLPVLLVEAFAVGMLL